MFGLAHFVTQAYELEQRQDLSFLVKAIGTAEPGGLRVWSLDRNQHRFSRVSKGPEPLIVPSGLIMVSAI